MRPNAGIPEEAGGPDRVTRQPDYFAAQRGASGEAERLRADLASRSSEARFRLLVDGVRDYAIFMTGPRGEVTSWNQGATRILGYPSEDVISEHLQVFYTEVDQQLDLAGEQLRLAERFGQYEDEGWRVRKDGQAFWAHSVLAALFDDSGLIGYSVVIRDLTERRRAQEAIQRRTDQLANVVAMQQRIAAIALKVGPEMERVVEEVGTLVRADGTAVGIVENGCVTYRMASGVGAECRGMCVSRDSRSARCIASGEWFRVDDCLNDPLVEQAIARRLGIGSLLAVPLAYDGRGIGILVVVYRAVNAIAESDLATLELLAGQLAAAISNALTLEANESLIAERTAALETLSQREERFRSLIENTSDCVSIIDIRGVIQYASPSHLRVLGYAPESLIQRRLIDLVHPDDIPRLESGIADMIANGTDSIALDLRKQHQSGSWRSMVSLFKNLLHDPGISGLVLSCRDVSDQTALEAQLRQSQKMDAVGQLAGGVAHDFNNLLTVIKGNVQLLREDIDPAAPAQVEIEEIRKAADRAAGLTRQLLAFSRKQMLHPRAVSLNDVIHEIAPMLRRLIGEDVDIRTELDPGAEPVLADPGQLNQILVNLAVNSRDAMPNGGTLTITTTALSIDAMYTDHRPGIEIPHGSYVRLLVHDNGTGMAEDVCARAFEPFFTTKESGKGTGLGLAMVYGIVKQSNGFVWLESSPGRGSQFEIVLPCAASGDHACPASRPEVEQLRGSETILLVEDEEPLRALALRVLQRHGYRVLQAHNGNDALRIASEFDGPIDLVVTDVVMPGMGGRDLAERLAKLRPRSRLIYMSGYTDDEIIRRGLLNPTLALLAKPFSPNELVQTVRRVLDGAPTLGSP